MCGIIGFLCANKKHSNIELRTIVNNMASTLHHRGPDNGGIWADDQIARDFLVAGARRNQFHDLHLPFAQGIPVVHHGRDYPIGGSGWQAANIGEESSCGRGSRREIRAAYHGAVVRHPPAVVKCLQLNLIAASNH